jgi:Zn-finger nucleic acid-binding protein
MPNPPLCPVCGKPERVTVTDCENADCPMCTDGWLDWQILVQDGIPFSADVKIPACYAL